MSTDEASPSRIAGSGKLRLRARLLRAVAGGAALIAGITLLAAVGLEVMNQAGLPTRWATQQRPELERSLGITFSLGKLRLHLLPQLSLDIEDLQITPAGAPLAPGVAAPLHLDSLRATVGFWRTLLSGGRSVRVQRVEATGLVATSTRLPDGRLFGLEALQRLVAHLPQPPLSPEQQRWVGRISIGHVRVSGALQLRDLTAADGRGAVDISQLQLDASEVRASAPFTFVLEAAALGAQRNLRAAGTLGPVPPDLLIERPLNLLGKLDLRVNSLELAPLLGWAAPLLPWLVPERAHLDADLHMDRASKPGALQLAAAITVQSARLRRTAPDGARVYGAPVDLGLRVDFSSELEAGSVDIRALELRIDDMLIEGKADVRDLWGSPRVEQLAVRSQGLQLQRLTAMLPPGVLPPGTRLKGPASVSGEVSGLPQEAQVALRVDLSDALIDAPPFYKPPQIRLRAALEGRVEKPGVLLQRLSLELGTLSVQLRGRIKSPRDIEIHLAGGSTQMAAMLALLPGLQERGPRRAVPTGQLELSGDLIRREDRVTANAKLAVTGLHAALRGASLHGDALLRAQGTFVGLDGTFTVSADLGGARLWVRRVMDKQAGTPLRLDVSGARNGTRLEVQRAEARFPGGQVQASGNFDWRRSRVELEVPALDVRLAPLREAFPSLEAIPLDEGRLQMSLRVEGDPQDQASLRVQVRRLSLQTSAGDLSGSIDLLGVAPPRGIDFDLHGSGLHLAGAALAAAGRLPQPPWAQTLPYLRRMRLAGKLKLGVVVVDRLSLRDVVAELSMADGRFSADVLRAFVWGGSIVASGSKLDLSGAAATYNLQLKAERVNVRSLVETINLAQAPRFDGRLSVDANAGGQGETLHEIWAHTTGSLGATATGVTIRDVTVRARMRNPGLKNLVGPDGVMTIKRDRVDVQALTVRATIGAGRIVLAEPLRMANSELIAMLNGSVGLDGSLDLRAKMELLPPAFANATKGQIVITAAVPVEVRVTGNGALPDIEIDKLDQTTAALSGGLLGSDRAPELRPPQPVPGEPGKDANAGRTVSRGALDLNRTPSSRFRGALKLGPSFGLVDQPVQALIELELGIAVTPDGRGSLILPLQVMLGAGPIGIVLPVGFQYDIRLPITAFSVYPRASFGYAALHQTEIDGGETRHLGFAAIEAGLKYAPLKRLMFGIEPVSLALLFDAEHVLLSYRMLAYGGFLF